MKRLALVLSLLLCTAPPLPCQISLPQAVSLALESNLGLRAAQASLEATNASVSSSWGRLLPEVDVQAFYTYMDKDLILNLDPIREAMIALQMGNQVNFSNLESLLKAGRALTPQEQAAVANATHAKLEGSLPHFQETVKERAFPQAVVSVRQPLFTGGRILAGIRAANDRSDAARGKLEGQRGEVIMETVQRYVSVLLAERNVRVRSEVLDDIRRHQIQAVKLEEQGLIARHDRLRADVAVSEAERNLFEAGEQVRLARIALGSSMNVIDTVLIQDSLSFSPDPRTLDDYLESAKQKNANLVLLRSVGKALHEKANVTFGSFFPTVYGFGMVNLLDHYMVKDLEPKWAVGIGASFQVFDGFRRSSEYQAEQAEARAMEYSAQEAERRVLLLVRSEFQKMQLARDRYQRLQASMTLAQENLRLHRKRYDTGLGTSLEALDAELALEGILLQRAQSLAEYWSSSISLHHAAGLEDAFLTLWTSPRTM